MVRVLARPLAVLAYEHCSGTIERIRRGPDDRRGIGASARGGRDDENRSRGVVDHFVGHASEQRRLDRSLASGANHDQIGLCFLSDIQDLSPDAGVVALQSELDGEANVASQLVALLRDLLRSLERRPLQLSDRRTGRSGAGAKRVSQEFGRWTPNMEQNRRLVPQRCVGYRHSVLGAGGAVVTDYD